MSIASNIKVFQNELDPIGVKLIAISKTKSNPEIMEAYQAGQRAFGENQVQELVAKHEQLPQDIEWHLVGHLQTNKVKYIAPFVSMIHSVDSLRLLKEINKQGEKLDRQIDCLIQVYIADEDTKFGLDHAELIELLRSEDFQGFQHIRIRGLMGIATNTDNQKMVKEEFYELKMLFDGIKVTFFRKDDHFDTLSMGMSSDYKLAIEQGSNMVRIGNQIFGQRVIKHFKAK
ncbi:MAG: YggS family pyridoxal phosphate-dependent enzyme [Sphingobacterium sp.]